MMFKDGVYYPLGTGEEESMGEYEERYAAGDGVDFFDGDPDDGRAADEDPAPGIWKQLGGAIILMTAMTDEHLGNAIGMLERKRLTQWPKYRELLAERQRRGDS